jgi:uncharacterized protein (TIGR03435 family)
MIRTTAALVVASVAVFLAQEAPRPLTFDVTSVKPNTSGEIGGSSKAEPGRYVGVNVTLRRVIGLAYLPVQDIVGGPGWINTDRFDIEGKSAGAANREQLQEMLRSLLADRFALAVHREVRQLPAYSLVTRPDGKTGPRLRQAQPCTEQRCGGFTIVNGSLKGIGVTMTQLAAELPSATEGRRVLDRTGLAGVFDVELIWNADALRPDAASAEHAASIFAAVQEQLGLKLEPVTAPTEVIVIDRAERPASN